MPRYGESNESVKADTARWQAGEAKMQEMLAKEAAATDALTVTTGRDTKAIRENAKAREEATEISRRAAAAAERETAATRAQTEQIERLAAARRRAAAAAPGVSGAVRGSTDPLLPQAYGLTQGGAQVPTQYRLRQQLAIGTPRALRLQEALAAGAAPEGQTPVNVREAQRGQVRAEQQLAEATKTLTNVRRRKSADDSEINAALSERDLARANVRLAKERVSQAEQDAALHQQNVAAIRAETAARERAAASAAAAAAQVRAAGAAVGAAAVGGRAALPPPPPPPVAREPGTAVQRHPTLYGYGGVTPPITTEPVYGPPPGAPRPVQEVNPFASGKRGVSTARLAETDAAAAAATTRMNAALAQEAAEAQVASEKLGLLQAQTTRVAAATREAAVIQRLYSDELHRHGALTAEFIQAAARGEVTLRQLGNEILVTIGKFAGWTVAATAVYGVVRAIGVLGHGAVQAQSGVHTLDRVIQGVKPGQAVQAFNQLSKEFNVPLDVAVDAVYRMGQSFHSLPEAVTAARAALYSYKTGEVDVASSTRNLIAITRGFGLGAHELLAVYNQINQAQNVFSLNIADAEKGIANAGGTFRNAGGDLTYLLSLFVAINKATAQSGTVIGTAINRGVTQFRTPKHQSMLEALGVDYDPADFQKTIESAIQVAHKAGTTGLQRRELAQALFGNQYARLIEPVLNDPRILRQAQQRLDPSRRDVQTSAARELAKVLKQADEQLHQIGNTLQRIGAQMQQSGLFIFAGVLLQGTNHLLGALEQVLKVFNLLPSPLRDTLALLLEITLAMKVLSRFGVPQRLQGIPGLGGLVNPGNRLRQQALSDQNAIVAASTRQRESAANALSEARTTQRLNLAVRTPLQENIARELARPGLADSEREKLLQQQAAIERETIADQNRAAIAERRVLLAQEFLAEDERNLAAVKAANARNIEATLAQRKILVTPFPGTTKPEELPTPVTGTRFLEQAEEEKHAVVTRTPTADRVTRRLEGTLGTYAASLAATNRIGAPIERGTRAVIDTTGRVVTSLERGTQGVRGMSARFSKLVESLGAFDYALIGIPVGLELLNLMNKAGEDAGKRIDDLDKLYDFTSDRELQDKISSERQKAQQRPSRLSRFFGGGANPLISSGPGLLFNLGAKLERAVGIDAQSPAEIAAQQRRLDAQAGNDLQGIAASQRQARAAGRPVPQRLPADIVRDINQVAGQARAGRISQKELSTALDRYAIEIRTAYSVTGPQAKTMNETFANAQRLSGNLNDFSAALAKLDDKGLQAAFKLSADTLKTFGANSEQGRKALEQLEREYAEANSSRRLGRGDATAIAALSQARDAFFGAINDAASAVLQEGLAGARTEGQRQRAFRNAQQLEYRRSTVERTFTVGGEHGTATVGTGERHFRDAAARRNYQRPRDDCQGRRQHGPQRPQLHAPEPLEVRSGAGHAGAGDLPRRCQPDCRRGPPELARPPATARSDRGRSRSRRSGRGGTGGRSVRAPGGGPGAQPEGAPPGHARPDQRHQRRRGRGPCARAGALRLPQVADQRSEEAGQPRRPAGGCRSARADAGDRGVLPGSGALPRGAACTP
jgi:hypothetical protein